MGGCWKGFVLRPKESGLFLVGTGKATKDVKKNGKKIRNEV